MQLSSKLQVIDEGHLCLIILAVAKVKMIPSN